MNPSPIDVLTSEVHYMQRHILGTPDTPESNEMEIVDKGNHDGPLGKRKHIVPPHKFCLEPEQYECDPPSDSSDESEESEEE